MPKDKKSSGKKTANKSIANVHKPLLDEVLEFAEAKLNDEIPKPPAAEPAKKQVTIPIESPVIEPPTAPLTGVSARSFLPDSEKERDILRQRAVAMAKDAVEANSADHREEYLRLRLGDKEEYGIPYEYLDEILYLTTITQVPCTPSHIAGVVNRRGEMLTVLDLQSFFHTRKTDNLSDARIIVVSGHNMRIGILVDEVISNDRYIPDQLAPALVSAGVTNIDYIKGIYDGKVAMLNMDALLSDKSLYVDEAV